MASSEENIDLATPNFNLVLWIFKQNNWGVRGKLFYYYFFYFGDKNYEASDYNKNKMYISEWVWFQKASVKKIET